MSMRVMGLLTPLQVCYFQPFSQVLHQLVWSMEFTFHAVDTLGIEL